MNSRVVNGVRGFLVLVLLGIFAGVAAAGSTGAPPSWCAFMGATGSAAGSSGSSSSILLPSNARYEVDLLGNLAHGTLSLEFTNGGETDRVLKFFSRKPSGIQVQGVGVALDVTADAEPLKVEHADAKGANKGRGKPTRSSKASPKGFGSDEISIGAEESVWVRVGFIRTLGFGDGRYQLRLPQVGGGACFPGQPHAAGSVAPLSVELRVHHGEPLEIAESGSHPLLVEFEGDSTVVELVAPDKLGEAPFEFAYALGASNEPALSSFVGPETDNGERDVLMVLAPSVAPHEETVRLKEVLFVLDTSGSMRGPKLDSAQGALVACLERLGGQDRFNLAQFDSNFTLLFDEPQEATADSLADSAAWLREQKGAGSTKLLPALDATLEQQRSPDHHRLVVVLTDGALGDENQVQQFLQEHLGEARLFFVGVGAEPNREKVRALAESARGTAVFADDPEGFAVAAQELFAGISAPLAWDLQVDWGDAQVLAMEPQRLPDLYTGRPVSVKARVKGELPPTLILEASTTGGVRTFEALLPAGGAREYPQMRALRSSSQSATKRKGGR